MRILPAALGVSLLLAGCSAAPAENTASATPPGSDLGSVTVFAAASMENALTELAELWAGEHGPEVIFSFGGSNGLVDQIVEGAPADVLVTADQTTMDRAVAAGLAADPAPLTTNTLVVALPAGNPGGYTTAVEALAGERLVVCAAEVPCGRATRELLELSGLAMTPVSLEQSVADVRGKIQSGEANAGVVYRTDASAADLVALPIPGADRVLTTSMTALVTEDNPAAAQFIAFLHSEAARIVLDSYGFGTP